MSRIRSSLLSLVLATLYAPAFAQTPAMAPDIAATRFEAIVPGADYTKQVVMIPMRDGVKLYTVIVVPKGARDAPIMLTRTPYDAAKRAERNSSPHIASMLPEGDDAFIANGYIRVFQDVRGKHGSEGDYVMTRPICAAPSTTPPSTIRPTPSTPSTGWSRTSSSRTAGSAWSAPRMKASPC
jgi:hypothetical protein